MSSSFSTQNILLRPAFQQLDAISSVIKAVETVFPVPSAKRKDLLYAIKDLSALLTQERGQLAQSYWSSPRLTSAYLRFFLPWNLLRLAWLLPQLPLGLNPEDSLLDLGSGPLTLPLALWCFRPELRNIPLTITCCDVAAQPLELGKKVISLLSGDSSPWRIICKKSTLDHELSSAARRTKYHLVIAGNVLNELSSGRKLSLTERFQPLVDSIQKSLVSKGRILFIEPGTRLGGKLIALTRTIALNKGFASLSPCQHSGPCPTVNQDFYYPSSPPFSGWCHFTFPAEPVPAPLAELSRKASLEKKSLALSYIFLQAPQVGSGDVALGDLDSLSSLEELYAELMDEDKDTSHNVPHERTPCYPRVARVISGPIRIPDLIYPARYACSEAGLVLVREAAKIPSGAAVTIAAEKTSLGKPDELRDMKTGALFVESISNRVKTPNSTGIHSPTNTPSNSSYNPRQKKFYGSRNGKPNRKKM